MRITRHLVHLSSICTVLLFLSSPLTAEGLKLGDHSSWRLPTIEELEGIYDHNNLTGKWSFRNSESGMRLRLRW